MSFAKISIIGNLGADPELKDRTEALIAAEEARAWERIRAYRERLAGKKVLLITGGVKSWSVVSALQEAGLLPAMAVNGPRLEAFGVYPSALPLAAQVMDGDALGDPVVLGARLKAVATECAATGRRLRTCA